MDFSQIFREIKIKKNCPIYEQIFESLKPSIIQKIQEYLQTRVLIKTGRPRTIDLGRFLDAVYFLMDSGSQMRYVSKLFQIPKSTFSRYFKLIQEQRIIENIYYESIQDITLDPIENCLITDTFIVKSMNGHEGTGRNPTDRGRKGIIVSLVSDDNLITHDLVIGPANQVDVKFLEKSVDKITKLERHLKCLADAGYVGHDIRLKCLKKRIDLIARPRKTRSGNLTHHLSAENLTLLKEKRNRIELLNSHIRRHRGLMIKWVRNILSYRCFLYIIILCITCYQRYIIHRD